MNKTWSTSSESYTSLLIFFCVHSRKSRRHTIPKEKKVICLIVSWWWTIRSDKETYAGGQSLGCSSVSRRLISFLRKKERNENNNNKSDIRRDIMCLGR
jgi:hypothetical protein